MTSPGGPTSTPGPPLLFDKIHHPSVRGAGPGRGGDFADKQEGSGGAARPPGNTFTKERVWRSRCFELTSYCWLS